ncbi:MAG: hypothetical protein ACM3X1_03685 [Ignavibacteriales bacterium]
MKIQIMSNRLYTTRKTTIHDLEFLQHNMFVIPIPFAKYHKQMLAHCKEMLEYQNGLMAIHPNFNKLIIALRTAVENGEGNLDNKRLVMTPVSIVFD